MVNTDHTPAPFFYGLQGHWLSRDRLYRVYVGDQMLAGAYVAGQVYDEQVAALQFQQAFFLLRPWVRRWLEQRQKREKLYDGIDPFTPAFLDLDARNFQLPRTDVQQVHFRRNRSWHMPYNVGSVEITLLDGTRRRFILLDQQDPEAVLQRLRQFAPDLEVTGKLTPWPRPTPLTPTQFRFFYLLMAVMFLACGVFFGYVHFAGLVRPHPFYLLMAAINILAGLGCIVAAWRDKRG